MIMNQYVAKMGSKLQIINRKKLGRYTSIKYSKYNNKSILFKFSNKKSYDRTGVLDKNIALKLNNVFFYLFLLRSFRYISANTVDNLDLFQLIENDDTSIILNNVLGTSWIKFALNILGILPIINSNIFIQLITNYNSYYKEGLKSNSLKIRIEIEYLKKSFIIVITAIIAFYYFRYLWPFIETPSIEWYLRSLNSLVCVSLLNQWIVEKIDGSKISQGLSIIFLFSILENFFNKKIDMDIGNGEFINTSLLLFLLFILFCLIILIFIQDSEKRIQIIRSGNKVKRHSSKTLEKNGKNMTYLPIKLNPGGVFSIVIMVVINRVLYNALGGSHIGFGYYFGEIFLSTSLLTIFNYNYSLFKLKIDNFDYVLKSRNSYIQGTKSGKENVKTLKKNVLAMSLIGSLLVYFLYCLINCFEKITTIEFTKQVSGNTLVIITTLSLDIIRRIISEITFIDYDKLKL
uniref:Thylakoid preprotein translocase n=1 Tax=Amorphochlora amoebiformis TaxID=1561963 RepID=A0A0H5BKS6_9EUKA|nr:thylakoid preprotein translocase [Amorphochlora amoebiformis]|mmetsp:Transcript_24143/g.38003  ORF Transcript_24143/g.38003 Transcript_24143/m.38003 type:complete len:460 (+) Transcript_24143:2323-3702(+)